MTTVLRMSFLSTILWTCKKSPKWIVILSSSNKLIKKVLFIQKQFNQILEIISITKVEMQHEIMLKTITQ